MFATVIALIIATSLFVSPYLASFVPDPQPLAILMAVVGSFCLPLLGMINLIPLIPLQRAEEKVTPRVVELFQSDRSHGWANLMLVLFPLFSYVFFFFLFDTFDSDVTLALFAIWIVLLGNTLDLLRKFFYHFLALLNPYHVVEEYCTIAHYLESRRNVEGACDWLGALSETGNKALHRNSTTVVAEVIDKMSEVAQNFLQKWQQREMIASEPLTDEEIEQQHYPLYFLLQRMESLFNQALEKRLEPICTSVITNLGKIAATAVRCGIPVSGFALHILGESAKAALKKDFEEVAIKASCTLEQVTKILIAEPQVASLDLKSPFLLIINQMDVLAKEMFRRDKSINLGALSQPFHELKELWQQEPLLSHPDHDTIFHELDRVTGEFVALEQVMLGKTRMDGEENEKGST